MSRKNRKNREAKRQRQLLTSCEHKSDRRTAEFLAARLDDVQDQLCDLIADMRTFEHYSEIEDAAWCLRLMQKLKRMYDKFAESGTWPDDD